mgnify:CR=1 FL=1
MKNSFLKIIKFLLVLFLSSNLYAENLEITSSTVTLDKKDSKMILKGNVRAIDENKNILEASEAKYLKNEDFLEETCAIKDFRYNDYFLRPPFVAKCNYDIMTGSLKTDFHDSTSSPVPPTDPGLPSQKTRSWGSSSKPLPRIAAKPIII